MLVADAILWAGESFVSMQPCFVSFSMAVSDYRVSERGQMALPAEARRRWNMADGGTVEIADLGDALVIVPAGRGGLRTIVSSAIAEAGGYAALAARASEEDLDLA